MTVNHDQPRAGGWTLVRAPMTFPVRNRPIYIVPVANMARKESETEWPKLAQGISGVASLHRRSQKILVHTVSYALAQYLTEHVQTPRPKFTYSNSASRDEALANYRTKLGAIMFAPSLDRGVDFRDEDCRVVIVAKMPFLNLGDPQIKARLYSPGGQLWYTVQSIRSLVQSTGRGVRSADDWCASYILDQQFIDKFKKSRKLYPPWWVEALDWSFDKRSIIKSIT